MSAGGPRTSAESGPAGGGAERRRISSAHGAGVSSETGEVAVGSLLEGSEAVVFDVLRQEGSGLTVRQIDARLSLTPGEVRQALQRLRERGLVTRLNTIVPSYICRRVDSR